MHTSPLQGVLYLIRGLKLILLPGVRRYVVMPLLINIAVFGLLIAAGAAWFNSFVTSLLPSLPGWLDWLVWPLWVLFILAALLVLFFTFSLLANLIAAPFNGLLAEAIERRLRGEEVPTGGGLWQLLRETPVILLSQIGKMGYAALRALPLLILFVIPGLNLIAPLLWFVFGAWMLALEYLDYPMGNHGLLFPEQRRRARERRLLVLGFGAAISGLTMIPVINFLVMPVAVAGATALWVECFSSPTGDSPQREAAKRKGKSP